MRERGLVGARPLELSPGAEKAVISVATALDLAPAHLL
jgi:hypothetical protein